MMNFFINLLLFSGLAGAIFLVLALFAAIILLAIEALSDGHFNAEFVSGKIPIEIFLIIALGISLDIFIATGGVAI